MQNILSYFNSNYEQVSTNCCYFILSTYFIIRPNCADNIRSKVRMPHNHATIPRYHIGTAVLQGKSGKIL